MGAAERRPRLDAGARGSRSTPATSRRSGRPGATGSPGEPGVTGLQASTPLAVDGRVYLADAAERRRGARPRDRRELWLRRFNAPNTGPNGIAYADGVVYGATDTRAFAISAETGRDRWLHVLINRFEQFVQIAPVVSEDVVLTSTVGFPAPGGKGTLYALDRANGRERWRFVTVAEPWRFPDEAGGGGAWQPLTVDGEGRVYAGNREPGAVGRDAASSRTAARSRGRRAGRRRCSRSRRARAGSPGPTRSRRTTPATTTSRTRPWSSATSSSVREGGRRDRVGPGVGRARWERKVGLHAQRRGAAARTPQPDLPRAPRRRRDAGRRGRRARVRARRRPLRLGERDRLRPPRRRRRGGRHGPSRRARPRLGEPLWERRLPSPVFSCATVANDVVLTADYDGTVYAFAAEDGRELWHARLRARTNACPAVVGDTLLVGAGVPRGPARCSSSSRIGCG